MLKEVVFCVIVLFAAIQCQGLDSIPGVDFLSASFDAVKGVPKLPIYRMNYNKNQTWTNISTKTKYAVPDELIATTTGRSLDYSVGNTIHTDEDYRRVQASSFSLSLKALPFAFSVSADYSQEHKLVQEYINKGDVTTTSANKWWSFYQLQQLPFNQSNIDYRFRSTLASLPESIDSPSDLEKYQAFIDFYGTHFATSCSFGGQVNVDQFMDSTYYSGLSDEFRKSQLSIKFNIQIYGIGIGLSGGISKEELEKEQDETFNKRSEVHTFYRGGDPTLMTDETQKQWLESVAKYPTYLNCTMIDLWKAIPAEFKVVAGNIKQLTQKYLATGSIVSDVLSKKKSVKQSTNPPTGSDKVFNGLDAITNEMKLPIFAPTYSGKKMKPSFDPTQSWDLPDNILVSEQAEVTSVQGSFVFNDVESYQGWVKERSTSSTLFGLFKKSKDSLKVITNYFEKSQSRIISLDYRSLYKIEFAPIATLMPPLHPSLKAALEALPDDYDADAYRSIFSTWGTHFYSMAILGGSAQYDAFFTKCLLDSYSSSYVKQQAGINIGILTASKSSMSQTGTADQVFSQNSEQTMKFSGGDPLYQNANSWDKWIGSIKSNPDIIYFKLRPIHEVITWSDTKSNNLARALTEYSDEAVAFDKEAKAEAFKKTTQITSGIEVRDPATKVFIGPVTSIPAGQSFPSASYHAQVTCERNEMGQLRSTLFTTQGGNKGLGEGPWVDEDCSTVSSGDFTIEGRTVTASGVCCFFPAAPVQSNTGIKIENCKLN